MPETIRKIGGDLFEVSLLDFETTCDLQPLLAPALADFLALYALGIGEAARIMGTEDGASLLEREIGEVIVEKLPEVTESLGKVSEVVARLAQKLPPETLRKIRRTLLQGATMNGKPLYSTAQGQGDAIGVLLRGRTMDFWRLLMFALEANYPDFFVLFRRGGGAREKASSPSGLTSSTGPAGSDASSS